jgi:hypothetical protein
VMRASTLQRCNRPRQRSFGQSDAVKIQRGVGLRFTKVGVIERVRTDGRVMRDVQIVGDLAFARMCSLSEKDQFARCATSSVGATFPCARDVLLGVRRCSSPPEIIDLVPGCSQAKLVRFRSSGRTRMTPWSERQLSLEEVSD